MKATHRRIGNQADPATVKPETHEFLRNFCQRPRLTELSSLEEEVKSVLSVRAPLYEEVAHYVIDTESMGIGQAVQAISRCLEGSEPMKIMHSEKS